MGGEETTNQTRSKAARGIHAWACQADSATHSSVLVKWATIESNRKQSNAIEGEINAQTKAVIDENRNRLIASGHLRLNLPKEVAQ